MEKESSKEKNPHAVAMGKLGGTKNTEAQKKARAENGKRGGRPITKPKNPV